MVPKATHSRPRRNAPSSAASSGGASSAGRFRTLVSTPTIPSAASAPTAQNAARQPYCCPTRVPSGIPATLETVRPASSTDSARARSPGPTEDTVATAATAQNAPIATAVTTRATNITP